MSDPTNTNKTASTINSVIQDANSIGTQLVLTLIIADVPFLGIFPIKQILSWFLGWLDGYLSKAEQVGATFTTINVQVSGEENAMTKAIAEIAAAQKSGDPNALKQALADYAAAQSALIHNDGSAPPG